MIDDDVVEGTILTDCRVATDERLVEFRIDSNSNVIEEAAFREVG